jgi:hypothetical protein
VIDDVGLLPVSTDAAEALFRVIDAAYEKRSIAISSNIHPSGFDELMPKSIATATVDRLLHHAHVLITEGQDSYRLAQATAGKGVSPSADQPDSQPCRWGDSWPPAGRKDGHQWGNSWPQLGRTRWPLTVERSGAWRRFQASRDGTARSAGQIRPRIRSEWNPALLAIGLLLRTRGTEISARQTGPITNSGHSDGPVLCR